MTGFKPLLTTHGIDLFENPDGGVFGYRGREYAGSTWHTGVEWRARRMPEEFDYRVASRHSGIAYFVQGCPDCVCVQAICRADDTGEHCLDMSCGFCLNGCSEDEHDPSGWPA